MSSPVSDVKARRKLLVKVSPEVRVEVSIKV